MQNFVNIQSTETVTNGRQELINNDLTVMSCSAGTSFPTTNIEQGMFCLRTDLNQLFQLKDLNPTWVMVFDLTQVATNKNYVDTSIAGCVSSSEVVTVPTANALLLLNSSGLLPANITGNAATATTASSCSGNSETATTAGACTGNAATSTKIASPVTISGVNFDGSASIVIPYSGLSGAPAAGNSVSILSGTIANGGTVPLPSGYTEAQCAWMVSVGNGFTIKNTSSLTMVTYAYVTDRTVSCGVSYYNGSWTSLAGGTANYIIIGVN